MAIHSFAVRCHRRFKVRYPVVYMGPSGRGEGTVMDLSASGWKVRGETSVLKGQTLALELYLDHGRTRIERARVIWTKGQDFGVRVEQADNDHLLQL